MKKKIETTIRIVGISTQSYCNEEERPVKTPQNQARAMRMLGMYFLQDFMRKKVLKEVMTTFILYSP